MSRFAEIFSSTQGASLKLTAVLPADLVVKFEGPTAGAGLAVGLLSLAPGCSWPAYRFATADQVFFVHKGQGRVSIGGRPTTVVPGILVSVPRETWVSWRNTGTSPLQLLWSAEPASALQCLRELAGLQTVDPAALESLAQRYGFEVQGHAAPAASPAEPSSSPRPEGPGRGRRRRRGRGGRGGQRQAAGQSAASPATEAPAPTPSAVSEEPTHAPAVQAAPDAVPMPPAPGTAGSGAGPRHRQRGRGGRGRGRGRRDGQRPQASNRPSTPSSDQPSPARESSSTPQSSNKPSGGRVKEVYMRGRWIQVSGDGPMVDLGRRRRPEQFKRSRPPSSAGGENLSEEL